MSTVVRAAGGVVWRRRDGGAGAEVAVVHRARYDDWSLPKGKLDKGESELTAAVREVGEEIGSTVAVARRVARIAYTYDDAGSAVDKTVAFWSMRHTGGAFVASDEVDEMRWLDVAAAARLVGYDMDRAVLDRWAAVPIADSLVVLVRHAKAGRRSGWQGDDDERPLERAGVVQADGLTRFLSCFAPDRVVSASPVRCVQTVAPFAEAAGLTMVVDPVFSDDGYETAPGASETAVLALARPGHSTVVCSQGGTIPLLVDSLADGLPPAVAKKASAWVLSFAGGAVVQADYYPQAPRG